MRYFFKIHRLNTVEDDPDGIDLPNAAAALSQAERAIAELRRKSGYGDPDLVMIVKDEDHHTVLSLPFLPGCA
jgi:uncharacterized protein DUF6894